MADLVALTEAIEAVDDPTASASVVQMLLDQAEALFEAACGRQHRPFSDVLTARAEVHDGSGRAELFLDYPVGTLTSVILGIDTTNPDETLVVSGSSRNVYVDPRVPVRLIRTDGDFGTEGDPLTVHVTYTTAADLPESARAAVLRATRLLYEAASVGVASERLGGYAVEAFDGSIADALEQDPIWALAVAAHREINV